ncbi:MAG: type II secretion system F family protein [Alphaproteobacteria bacterium]
MGGGPSKAQKRAIQISGGKSSANTGLMRLLKPEDGSNRRRQIEQSLGDIETAQKDKKKRNKTLKAKLVQANWNVSDKSFTVITLGIGAALGFAVFAITKNPMASGGGAFIVGFGLPRWFLNSIIARRQKKFIENFADAMDIIVRGVRTGLPLGDCLKIIAHESPEPVRGEFLKVIEAEGVGVPIEICLERMYERIPVSEVNFFSTVLNIQRTTGGNLGESLANLSNVLRGRKLLREKIKALSAEAKMSAIIIGALPLIVMVLVTIASPDYMTELYTTKTGHRNLMIGAAMMVMGILTMRKMINFKF